MYQDTVKQINWLIQQQKIEIYRNKLRNKTKEIGDKCGIYAIRNYENGRAYIGKSENVEHRLNTHMSQLHYNKHRNYCMQNDYNQNGGKSFKFDLLRECVKEELDRYESIFSFEMNSLSELGLYNDISSRMLDYRNITDEMMENIYVPYFYRFYPHTKRLSSCGDKRYIHVDMFKKTFGVGTNDLRVILKLMERYEQKTGLNVSLSPGYSYIYLDAIPDITTNGFRDYPEVDMTKPPPKTSYQSIKRPKDRDYERLEKEIEKLKAEVEELKKR